MDVYGDASKMLSINLKKEGSHTQQFVQGNGFYNCGQLGLEKDRVETLNIKRPFENIQYLGYLTRVSIEFLSDNDQIKDIVFGKQHTVILTEKGACFGCGKFDMGQCGIEIDTEDESKERDVDFEQKILYTPRKMLFIDNEKQKDPVIIEKVVCGAYHTLCLDSAGRVWVFGVCPVSNVVTDENGQISDIWVVKHPQMLDLDDDEDVKMVDMKLVRISVWCWMIRAV